MSVATMDEQMVPAYYYYVDPEVEYMQQQPNPQDDLIAQYNLSDIAQQVARTNQDGTKAVKLRKSYKNQVADLSGKFSTIPTRENGKGGELAHILFQNNLDMLSGTIRKDSNMSEQEWIHNMQNRDAALFQSPNMDWELCQNVLSQFERSYPSEFQQAPGFQVDDLAFDLAGTGKVGGSSKKRKMNRSNGSSMTTTPNSTEISNEDIKRRRLE